MRSYKKRAGTHTIEFFLEIEGHSDFFLFRALVNNFKACLRVSKKQLFFYESFTENVVVGTYLFTNKNVVMKTKMSSLFQALTDYP